MTAQPIDRKIVAWPGFAILFNPSDAGKRVFIFLNPVKKLCVDTLPQDGIPLQDAPCIAGFISYEYGRSIESIRHAHTDTYNLPDSSLYEYSKVIELAGDKRICHQRQQCSTPLWEASDSQIAYLLDSFSKRSSVTVPSPSLYSQTLAMCSEYSNFTKRSYEHAVQQIRREIEKGEVYQVNLSQQISIPGVFDAWDLFLDLTAIEQGSFSAFISVGDSKDPKHIISNSPELLFDCTDLSISVCPIKGTVQRSDDAILDGRRKQSLFESEKDRAELAMIVDLLRNDLGKIAVPGTILVEQFPLLFSLNKVHHLCAPITAKLKSPFSFRDIVNALFPSGSVTGAPKIAAMNLISDLEKKTRGIYCGSIGWIGHAAARWNVAIRSGVVTPTHCTFQAGGGITFDSDPECEYYETIDKAASFIQAITRQI